MFSFHQININVLMNLPVLEVHFHIPVPLRVFLPDHMSPPPPPPPPFVSGCHVHQSFTFCVACVL